MLESLIQEYNLFKVMHLYLLMREHTYTHRHTHTLTQSHTHSHTHTHTLTLTHTHTNSHTQAQANTPHSPCYLGTQGRDMSGRHSGAPPIYPPPAGRCQELNTMCPLVCTEW